MTKGKKYSEKALMSDMLKGAEAKAGKSPKPKSKAPPFKAKAKKA